MRGPRGRDRILSARARLACFIGGTIAPGCADASGPASFTLPPCLAAPSVSVRSSADENSCVLYFAFMHGGKGVAGSACGGRVLRLPYPFCPRQLLRVLTSLTVVLSPSGGVYLCCDHVAFARYDDT